MPLILLSGLPTSGKTFRSEQICSNFAERISSSTSPRVKRLKIVHINDQSLGLDRVLYDAGRLEKNARATFMSAVKRELGADTIVIADGMNYIKGYRYQLYCDAKEARTTSCVVQPGVPPDICRKMNTDLLSRSKAHIDGGSLPNIDNLEISQSQPTESKDIKTLPSSSIPHSDLITTSSNPGFYPPTIHENLIFRHEEPNGMTRWDSPLFVIAHDDRDPPYDAIWTALVGPTSSTSKQSDSTSSVATSSKEKDVGIIVRPNQATVLKKASEQGYLAYLDKVCMRIIGEIETWCRDNAEQDQAGVRIRVYNTDASKENDDDGIDGEDGDLVVELPNDKVAGPQLQRLRRQFVAFNRVSEIEKSRLPTAFVRYLNDSFGTSS